MKRIEEGKITNKNNAKQSLKDKLQVKGSVNISFGIQIFGLESQAKREKIFRLLMFVFLVSLIIAAFLVTKNENFMNDLTGVMDKLLVVLQVAASSKEMFSWFFKDFQAQNKQ
jgi:hypothetical protein